LSDFFVSWYLDIENNHKIKPLDFIQSILSDKSPNFFYLCEVNKEIYHNIINLNLPLYNIISKPFDIHKTSGILFVKKLI